MDMTEGLLSLITGMGTVFIILIVIALIISLFKYIKPNNAGQKNAANKSVHFEVPAMIEKEVPKQDDTELVAVIMTAIAASLNTTTDKLIVTSFRKINSQRINR